MNIFEKFLKPKDVRVVGIKESGIGLVGKESEFMESGKTDSSENDKAMVSEAIKIYDNFPLAKYAVDSHAEQAVTTFHFEGPNRDKNKEFAEFHNIQEKLYDWAVSLGKTGLAVVEAPKSKNSKDVVDELKLLETEYITIHRLKTGKIIGVSQEKFGNDALWGTTGKRANDSKYRKRRPLDNIIIFKTGNGKYGKPLVYSSRHMFRVKDRIEAMLPDLVQRYASPIIHAKVGDEMNPPTSEDVDDVADMLEDIYSDTEYSTSYLVKLDVLDFGKKGIDIEPILNHIDDQIEKGLRVPSLRGNDGKLAEVKLKFFNRYVKSLQRILKTQYEDKIIINLGIGSSEDKIIFEEPDEREREAANDTLVNFVNAGVITRQKANDLLPPRFREKLPEMEFSGEQNDTKVNKMANPTDPTKSTKAQDGKRITRSDKKMAIDDEGENQKSRDKK